MTGADAGKFGVYSYVEADNNGNAITMTARLGPAAAGDAVTSLAGQTWDSAIHTNAHPTGSLIIPVNAKCVQYGYALFLGVDSVCLGWGKYPLRDIRHDDDYEDQKGLGIESYYGLNVPRDVNGNPYSYLVMEMAIRTHGSPLPAVTS